MQNIFHFHIQSEIHIFYLPPVEFARGPTIYRDLQGLQILFQDK